MSFQTPITIQEAIENIATENYLLPAIQREFEWNTDRIEWLFDSLMRDYPISSFLFWNVEGSNISGYRFYKFLREYRERYQIHNENANVDGKGNFTAILDGQQRLTALYIGLKGSYAYKERYKKWADNENCLPTRHLYLNIQNTLNEKEEQDGRIYEFTFLKDSETELKDLYKGKWFRVGKIWDLRDFSIFLEYINDNQLNGAANTKILARLQELVFTKPLINFFLQKEQDFHKALNIFIRINSGGVPLDFSDLIMSIAISNWEKRDARKEIHSLVDRIRATGFYIEKDLIFRTYLYLFSADIQFKVTNFTAENAHNFERDWYGIRDAIERTFDLIDSFGFNDYTLVSKNAVIPIVYYLYHRGIYKDFKTGINYREDRDIIARWLHVVTLKQIFGGNSNTVLSQIRRAFTENVTSDVKIVPDISLFPTEQINSHLRRDTTVNDEFIEELLDTQKDDKYAFSILALLNPQLDYRNKDFHKDHLHPISLFEPENIETLNLSEKDKALFLASEWNDSIVNLQMLDSNENKSKQDKQLACWIKQEAKKPNAKSRDQILDRCIIPGQVSLEFKDFAEFARSRKQLLKEKLAALLK